MTDPNLMEGGRRSLFNFFPIVGRGGLTEQGINIIHILILSLFSILIFLLRQASLAEFPYALKLLFFAGLLCFALAWVVALVTNSFLLYLPSRYTQASLFIVTLMYVFANAGDSFKIAAHKLVINRQRIFLLTFPAVIVLLGLTLFLPKSFVLSGGRYQGFRLLMMVLAVILLTLTAIAARSRPPTNPGNPNSSKSGNRKPLVAFAIVLLFFGLLYMKIIQVPFYVASEEERQLFSFLESLPEDVLIAGNPCDLDGVPLFAGRAVQSSCESPNPDQTVVLAGLEAYYAESADGIVDYCLEYGVDYLVVNQSSFSRAAINRGKYFFEPFDSLLRSKLTSQSTFALNTVAPENELFKTGNLFVVRCNSSSLE